MANIEDVGDSTHRENSILENENLWENDQGCGQEQSHVVKEYNLEETGLFCYA